MAVRDFDYERDRSVGDLVGDLVDESRRLLRQEIELAKTEMTQTATRVGKDAGMMAVGGVIAYLGLFFVLTAATIGLGHLIGYGWAALVVGIVVVAAGAAILIAGRNDLKRVDLAPREAKRNVKETKLWLKEQMH
ncbi:MAG: phage holin family protein [Thermoanaerobaculia bacterium]